MKNFLLRSFYLIVTFLVLSIIYLSSIGLETDKFNDQIKDKIYKTNNSLDVDLKKIKLTLDPVNFKINSKTVGTNIYFKGKNLPLEYINSEISILSLIKGKIVSTEIKISTRSVLLKDLVATKSFNNTDLVEILISVETIFPFISDKIEISEFIYSKGKFLPLKYIFVPTVFELILKLTGSRVNLIFLRSTSKLLLVL